MIRIAKNPIEDRQAERLCNGVVAERQAERIDGGALIVGALDIRVMRIGRVDTARAGKCLLTYVEHGRKAGHAHHILGGVDGSIKRSIGKRSTGAQPVAGGKKLRDEELHSRRIEGHEMVGDIRRSPGGERRVFIGHPLAERAVAWGP